MKIIVDQHHFLCIEHPEMSQIKQYTYQVSGYQFSDWDKGMVVLHKKDIKITNLKHFGDGMNLVYIKENSLGNFNLDIPLFKKSFGLFRGFDEITGHNYYFLPNFSKKNIESLNTKLNKLSVNTKVSLDTKGVLVSDVADFSNMDHNNSSYLNILFGLLLIYGKFESKGTELLSIKIQLPLFGQYLRYQEELDLMISDLQLFGLFLKKDLLETNMGIVYQISCNDWELLELFAKWYEPIEKFEKISKKAFTQEMKDTLVAFLVSDPQIPENGRQEVLDLIQSGVLKFLMKS